MICGCGNDNQNDFRIAKTGYRSKCVKCLSKQKALSRLKRSGWTERCGKIATRAKHLGVNFDLTPQYLSYLFRAQRYKCFYTDYDMNANYGMGHSQYALSVDRVVPERGYVKDNIVLCTTQANSVKNNLTLSELKLWIPSWYDRLNSTFSLDEFTSVV